MKTTCLATLVALLLASGANALSLTLDTDKETYCIGETVTITATLDTAGAPAGTTVAVQVTWADASAEVANAGGGFGSSSQIVTSGPSAGSSNLTTFGGNLPWTGPPTSNCVSAGAGAGNTCTILNQFVGATPFVPDAATLVGTLELLVVSPLHFNLGVGTLVAFGVTPVLTDNFQNARVGPGIPEPSTAALLALGLLGLAATRRGF